MKNVISLTAVAATLIFAAAACGGGSDSSSTRASTGNMVVDAANRALSEVAYSPGGKGFAYKAVAVPTAELNKWAKDNKDKIESAIGQLPSDYILQITGHSDSRGPRTAPGDGRLGNEWYSTQRAKKVYDALRAQGMPADKITFKGVADDMISGQCDSEEACQRRVSLQVVPKS